MVPTQMRPVSSRAERGVGRAKHPHNRILAIVVVGQFFLQPRSCPAFAFYHNPIVQYRAQISAGVSHKHIAADGRIGWTNGVDSLEILLGLGIGLQGKVVR
jgi:hypothetical protein